MHSSQRSKQQVTQEALDWLAQSDEHHLLTLDDPQYPWLLRHISSPPVVLFVKGNLSALGMPAIGMVGSRYPSPQGNQNAYAFAHALVQSGLSVVSGLAMGIDTQAHLGALDANGTTVAVLGTGLDTIYPKCNKALATRIVEQQGALVSEFFPQTPARAHHFPQRNRIISGLSKGVLVVEATLRSGSLITARYAAEQSRDVYAIPGSIHHPLARGCHALIRTGAKLVECLEDILEEYSIATIGTPPVQFIADAQINAKVSSDPQNVVYYLHDNQATSLDALALQCGIPIDRLSASLLELELAGVVMTVPGGYVKAPRKPFYDR